jgi:hypothetical protein
MSKEVMKLALEALESCGAGHITDGGNQWHDEKLVDKAIKALEETLASEQEQGEPVAEVGWGGTVNWHKGIPDFGTDLYTIPQQRKPLSEAAIEGLAKFVAIDDFNYDFARAIEKAHGIKE